MTKPKMNPRLPMNSTRDWPTRGRHMRFDVLFSSLLKDVKSIITLWGYKLSGSLKRRDDMQYCHSCLLLV